jgi:hypothetical protein
VLPTDGTVGNHDTSQQKHVGLFKKGENMQINNL